MLKKYINLDWFQARKGKAPPEPLIKVRKLKYQESKDAIKVSVTPRAFAEAVKHMLNTRNEIGGWAWVGDDLKLTYISMAAEGTPGHVEGPAEYAIAVSKFHGKFKKIPNLQWHTQPCMGTAPSSDDTHDQNETVLDLIELSEGRPGYVYFAIIDGLDWSGWCFSWTSEQDVIKSPVVFDILGSELIKSQKYYYGSVHDGKAEWSYSLEEEGEIWRVNSLDIVSVDEKHIDFSLLFDTTFDPNLIIADGDKEISAILKGFSDTLALWICAVESNPMQFLGFRDEIAEITYEEEEEEDDPDPPASLVISKWAAVTDKEIQDHDTDKLAKLTVFGSYLYRGVLNTVSDVRRIEVIALDTYDGQTIGRAIVSEDELGNPTFFPGYLVWNEADVRKPEDLDYNKDCFVEWSFFVDDGQELASLQGNSKLDLDFDVPDAVTLCTGGHAGNLTGELLGADSQGRLYVTDKDRTLLYRFDEPGEIIEYDNEEIC